MPTTRCEVLLALAEAEGPFFNAFDEELAAAKGALTTVIAFFNLTLDRGQGFEVETAGAGLRLTGYQDGWGTLSYVISPCEAKQLARRAYDTDDRQSAVDCLVNP